MLHGGEENCAGDFETCNGMCTAAEGSEDPDLLASLDDWMECVADHKPEIRQEASEYGGPTTETCGDARDECGWYPCQNSYSAATGYICTGPN